MTTILLTVIAIGVGVLVFRKAPSAAGMGIPLKEHGAVSGGKKPMGKGAAVLLMILAIAYLVSPLDFLPDIIPLLGWLDDAGIVTLAGTNLARSLSHQATAS